jgi:TIR domain
MALSSDGIQEDSLRTLCADLGLAYDELGGEDLDDKKFELVTACSSRGLLNTLEDAVTRVRSMQTLGNDLPSAGAPQPIALFISYSHKDEKWREELQLDLERMQEDGLIDAWYDGKILAGDDFDEEIRRKLHEAHIILLLVSRRFLGSKYIRRVEVPAALQRHEAGEARVIPIIVKPSPWEEVFSELKVVPKDGKPIATWRIRDQAFMEVYARVRDVVADLANATGNGG